MITITTSSYEIEKAYDELEMVEGPLTASRIVEEQIGNIVSDYLGHHDMDVVEDIMKGMWECDFENMGELIQSAI